MSVKAKKVKRVVDEMAKLEKGEIEFLFETIKEARILGKYIPVAMGVVTKLKNQYKLLDRKEYVIKKEEDAKAALENEIKKAQQETYKRMKQVDGELYIEDE
jgi:sortase (surface protein transpeptidase)